MSLDVFDAAEKGDIETVRDILQRDPGQARAVNGEITPLHCAAGQKYLEIVELLLRYGADVNARCEGETALHYAAHTNAPEVVKLLLNNGADPNVVDDRGYTPLVISIAEQMDDTLKIAKLLMQAGAEYDLTAAGAMGDLDRVREILENDPVAIRKQPSAEILLGETVGVGHFGTMEDRYEIVQLLFAHGLQIEKDKLLAMAQSCETSNVGDFGRLLREFASKM